MQGALIIIVGIGLMYLVLSGKLDCLIAASRACAGSTSDTPTTTTGLAGASGMVGQIDNILSPKLPSLTK